MSWCVYFEDKDGEVVTVSKFIEGGIVQELFGQATSNSWRF
jgi:hypothetical protein